MWQFRPNKSTCLAKIENTKLILYKKWANLKKKIINAFLKDKNK